MAQALVASASIMWIWGKFCGALPSILINGGGATLPLDVYRVSEVLYPTFGSSANCLTSSSIDRALRPRNMKRKLRAPIQVEE